MDLELPTPEEALLGLFRARQHLLDAKALQQQCRDHRHDDVRLGLEVLLQLLCATVRHLASTRSAELPPPPPSRSRKEAVLVPETQAVDLGGAFGGGDTKVVPETMAIGEDEPSQERLEADGGGGNVSRAKPNGRFSDGFHCDDGDSGRGKGKKNSASSGDDSQSKYGELDCIRNDDSTDDGEEGSGVFGNGNGPAAIEVDTEEESPSILYRGKDRNGAARVKKNLNDSGSFLRPPDPPRTNKLGVNFRDKPSPSKRPGGDAHLKQMTLDAFKNKQPRKIKKESDDEEDVKIAMRQSMETAAREEEERQRADLDDTFDRLPGAEDEDKPKVKVVTTPVRNKLRRRQLQGHNCPECEKYYANASLSPEEVERLLAQCSRHRAVHPPPANSPQDFYKMSSFYHNGEAEQEEKPSPLKLRKRRKKDT